MKTLDLNMFNPLTYYLQFPSGDVDQRLSVPWFSPSMTFNYAGNPTIENRVTTEVASTARQVGWLSDLVLALADHGKLPKDPLLKDSFEKLRDAADRIKTIKQDVQRSARETATEALDRLKAEQPEAYKDLLRSRIDRLS